MGKYQTAENYSRKAERYEKQWRRYLRHTHERFFHWFETKPHDVVLDISAGTGLLASAIISNDCPFDELILNDLSEGMLEVAAARIPEDHAIQLLNDEAEDVHLPDGSVDRIICLSAFHHYEDHKAVLTEVRRLLKPGGTFYLLDWNRSGIFRLFNYFIEWKSGDHVNTASFEETLTELHELGFAVQKKEQWWWTWWNFYFIVSDI